MEEDLTCRIVRIEIDMIDSLGVEGARSTDQAMDFIALFKEELGKVTSILAGNAAD